ncbi:MAG TPA: hypothetical protein DCP92_17675 [Nitrospiraceae bacterium]|nr:hypothetical protein [Nitrospiraceae bacterium]
MNIWLIINVILFNIVFIAIWEFYRKRRSRKLIEKNLNSISEIQDLLKKEKFDVALSMSRKLEKYCPPVAYELMGNCYYGMGDKDSAEEFYMKAIAMDHTMDMVYVDIAKIQKDKGEYSSAEESLKKALEINKENYMAMYYLSEIYSIWGKYSDAASFLENAIATGLILRDAYIMLRDYYQSVGDYPAAKRMDEQIALLDQKGN